ncbi:flippase [Belliella pelovolcani]|uniref:flippase n=1 Tax=Belliella pelovolcani TaxID=529505 RepID=UPI00391B84B8
MRIRSLFQSEDNKRLLANIFSLGTIQVVNYILPLLTVPYLVRVLEPDFFGLLAFATATVSYLVMITDYGFNLSATRQISINRENQVRVNELFNATMMIKFGLMVLSFLILCILVLSIEKFSQNAILYFITFGMVVGQFLFPVWLFQGMEKMKYITYINVSTKVIFTVCIFIFIKEQGDYLLVQGLTAASFVISGLLSLLLARKKFQVYFYIPPKDVIMKQLQEGWHIFTSNLAISLYTTSTTFILGIFTNNTLVGYYAAAEKIIQAAKGLNAPVSQAMYPLISKKIHKNKAQGLRFLTRAGKRIGTVMLIISGILFVFSVPISNILLGEQYQESIQLLRLMAFLPFIIAISNLFAVQGLYNLGKESIVSRYLSIIACLHLGVISVMIVFYGIVGAAIGVLITETMVSICSIYYFKKELRYES